MPERKIRVPIPADDAARVLFESDRTCCVCHVGSKQVQIHHINDNPSDNRIENLAVLCLECHGQTQLSGGFGRRLNSNLVTLYRNHWVNLVSMRRSATMLHNEIDRTNKSAPLSHDASQTNHTQNLARPTPFSRLALTPTLPSEVFGATYQHVGIKITLIDVACSRTINLNVNGSFYDDEHEVVQAGRGAKFVSVTTRVFNDAQVSIDLTCGYPIGNHVIDDRGRQFDAIDRLYQIPGNPECNANLQPGFESDMTWIYRVPETANILNFEFEDLTDWTRDERARPTRIPINVPEPA